MENLQILIYINNYTQGPDDNKETLKTIYTQFLSHVIELNADQFSKDEKDKYLKIINHLGNSIYLKAAKSSNLLFPVLDILSTINQDFRISVHAFEENLAKIKIVDINKEIEIMIVDKVTKIIGKSYQLNDILEIVKDTIFPLLPYGDKENGESSFKYITDNHLLGSEIKFTQDLAYLHKPFFVLSRKTFNSLYKEMIGSIPDEKKNINFSVDELNKALIKKILLDKKESGFCISPAIPFYNNNTLDFCFWLYSIEKSQGDIKLKNKIYVENFQTDNTNFIKEKCYEIFFKNWREEKRNVEKIYIGYIPYKAGKGNAIKTEHRKGIIRTTFPHINEPGQLSLLDRYYFDLTFSVIGSIPIDFHKKYKSKLSKTEVELVTLISLCEDDPKKYETLIKEVYEEYSIIGKDTQRSRVPLLISFLSFPDDIDETKYRPTINAGNGDYKLYYRTEDVFDNISFEKVVVKDTDWSEKNNSEFINRDVVKDDKDDKYEKNLDLNNVFFEKYTFHALHKEDLFRFEKIKDNNWYILLIFRIETTKFNIEHSKDILFEKLKDKEYGINSDRSPLKVFSYGIIRGSWDAFILCHVDKNFTEYKPFCFGQIIKYIFIEKNLNSYIKEYIAKTEVFFLRPVIKDNWSENMLKSSIE